MLGLRGISTTVPYDFLNKGTFLSGIYKGFYRGFHKGTGRFTGSLFWASI